MTTVHCTIETDPDTGTFVGWVVGFRHFNVTGASPDEVEAREMLINSPTQACSVHV